LGSGNTAEKARRVEEFDRFSREVIGVLVKGIIEVLKAKGFPEKKKKFDKFRKEVEEKREDIQFALLWTIKERFREDYIKELRRIGEALSGK